MDSQKVILLLGQHGFALLLLLVPLTFLSLSPLCSASSLMIFYSYWSQTILWLLFIQTSYWHLYLVSIRFHNLHLLASFVSILYFHQQSVHVQAEVEHGLVCRFLDAFRPILCLREMPCWCLEIVEDLVALTNWQVSSSAVFQPNYDMNYGFPNSLSNLN